MLREALGQSQLAKEYIGYAVLTHGACEISDSWYGGMRSELRRWGERYECSNDLSCDVRAYLYHKYSPSQRESAALASYKVLTTLAPPPIFHFNSKDSPFYAYWSDSNSCPSVYSYDEEGREVRWFVIDGTRFC